VKSISCFKKFLIDSLLTTFVESAYLDSLRSVRVSQVACGPRTADIRKWKIERRHFFVAVSVWRHFPRQKWCLQFLLADSFSCRRRLF